MALVFVGIAVATVILAGLIAVALLLRDSDD